MRSQSQHNATCQLGLPVYWDCPNIIRVIVSIQADAFDCAYTVQNPSYNTMFDLQLLYRPSLMENYLWKS